MKIYSKWKDEEVIKLFRFIENGKKENIKLTKLFFEYAKLTNRKPNSVRNYYYLELCNLMENERRRKKFDIDVSLHEKTEQKIFSKDDEIKLTSDIEMLVKKGYSVRKACLSLANNDLQKMVRLQNKYRSILEKNRKNCNFFQKNAQNNENNSINNIISFPGNKLHLSENDINSLFLGLVKLVKKQAEDEIKNIYKNNLISQNEKLRDTVLKLCQKENEIIKLREDIKLVDKKNFELEEEIKILRSEGALINKNINQKLKQFACGVNKKSKTKIS